MSDNGSIFRKTALRHYQKPMPELIFPKSMGKPMIYALCIGTLLLVGVIFFLAFIRVPSYANGKGVFTSAKKSGNYFQVFIDVDTVSAREITQDKEAWIDCSCFKSPVKANITSIKAFKKPEEIKTLWGESQYAESNINAPQLEIQLELQNDKNIAQSTKDFAGMYCDVKIQTGRINFIELW